MARSAGLLENILEKWTQGGLLRIIFGLMLITANCKSESL